MLVAPPGEGGGLAGTAHGSFQVSDFERLGVRSLSWQLELVTWSLGLELQIESAVTA